MFQEYEFSGRRGRGEGEDRKKIICFLIKIE